MTPAQQPAALTTSMALSFLVTMFILGFPSGAHAHGGGISEAGGHVERATGQYHFHQGLYAGLVFASSWDAMEFIEAEIDIDSMWEYTTADPALPDTFLVVVFKGRWTCAQRYERPPHLGAGTFGYLVGYEWCRPKHIRDITYRAWWDDDLSTISPLGQPLERLSDLSPTTRGGI